MSIFKMRVFTTVGIVLLAPMGLANAANENSAQSNSREQQSNLVGSQAQSSDEVLAREWNLTPQDWQRYKTLMQSSRGVYSPGLDPLTALGIEARSDVERRRFAELQVKAEAQRTAKELAYQQAYDDAFRRLYPNMMPIASSASQAPAASPANQGNGRLAVFVKDDCPECSIRVKALQTQKLPFDVYMVGSQNDDERIRNWAIVSGIDPANVRTRQITLNHDGGRWLGLSLGGELPAVVREVNGQWLRQ
ncbi:TIGR03759 family integrating conjugative element protein [Pseudomonas syringae group sp. J309-1]|uniref:TIGR03759 family integrating conjugative element protein n=1 Tax=Pseudomonas syringae group sp. J309-1 TaxID=3079588 RepID=UPI0029076BA8|nr:TIGR03759 family integrating conjugative element protein [Pseudomonas syringae group sp. J309-1]MDU8358460.1 TIGR03759 family integrating conjugative element protein [Pseudomonas syringae group sp. J309-1]